MIEYKKMWQSVAKKGVNKSVIDKRYQTGVIRFVLVIIDVLTQSDANKK